MASIAERFKELIQAGREALVSSPSREEIEIEATSPPPPPPLPLPPPLPQQVTRTSRNHVPSPLRHSSTFASSSFPNFNNLSSSKATSSPTPSPPTSFTPSALLSSSLGRHSRSQSSTPTRPNFSGSLPLPRSRIPAAIQRAPNLSPLGLGADEFPRGPSLIQASLAEDRMQGVLRRSQNGSGKAWWEES